MNTSQRKRPVIAALELFFFLLRKCLNLLYSALPAESLSNVGEDITLAKKNPGASRLSCPRDTDYI
jgi:hypothetical protein